MFALAVGTCESAGPMRMPAEAFAGESASHGHSMAPAFSVAGLAGGPLSLKRYRGKVVLLDFWATWCAPCRTEIPRFVEFQSRYGSRGFQVIGISMDDEREPVRHFYRTFGMNYPVGMGNLKIARSYGGILGLPVTFLIGRDGRIHSKISGAADLASLQAEIEALL